MTDMVRKTHDIIRAHSHHLHYDFLSLVLELELYFLINFCFYYNLGQCKR